MQRLTTTRQQTLTSPSPPPLPTLPLDLIEEILWRLPVKHLLQLRCVCKPWKTLISNPQFTKKHLLRCGSPKETRLIISFTSMQLHEFILRSYPLPSMFNADTASAATDLTYRFTNREPFNCIVGSCDGILCVSVHGCPALLWNPSIGKSKTLPPLHQCGMFPMSGFGYDRCAGSYKVVSIFLDIITANAEVKVLTLGTDYWRSIRDQFPADVFPLDVSGQFVGDSINWLTRTFDVPKSWVIVSLDLRNESFGEVSQPDYGEEIVTVSLSVLRDCLCILSGTHMFFDVWLMKDYGNKKSWTKLLKVHYFGIFNEFGKVRPLYVSEDDHQVLCSYESELVVYNSKDSTVKIPELQNIISEPIMISSTVYVESLISPCS